MSIERTDIGTVLYQSNTVPLYKKDRYWSITIPFRNPSIVPSNKNRRSLLRIPNLKWSPGYWSTCLFGVNS